MKKVGNGSESDNLCLFMAAYAAYPFYLCVCVWVGVCARADACAH